MKKLLTSVWYLSIQYKNLENSRLPMKVTGKVGVKLKELSPVRRH